MASTRKDRQVLMGHTPSFSIFLNKHQKTLTSIFNHVFRLSIFNNTWEKTATSICRSCLENFNLLSPSFFTSFPAVSIWKKIQIYFKYNITNSNVFFQEQLIQSQSKMKIKVKILKLQSLLFLADVYLFKVCLTKFSGVLLCWFWTGEFQVRMYVCVYVQSSMIHLCRNQPTGFYWQNAWNKFLATCNSNKITNYLEFTNKYTYPKVFIPSL